jgi:hypothetical protein
VGTPLYDRTMSFTYEDEERGALMRKVWSGTPFMTNCNTGAGDDRRMDEIRMWCRERWGDEAWPIHGRPGRWYVGGATVFGWTWIGFESAAMLAEFEAAHECRDEV